MQEVGIETKKIGIETEKTEKGKKPKYGKKKCKSKIPSYIKRAFRLFFNYFFFVPKGRNREFGMAEFFLKRRKMGIGNWESVYWELGMAEFFFEEKGNGNRELGIGGKKGRKSNICW